MNLLDVAQATRGDIAELRHEMQLRFAQLDTKIEAVDAKFPVLEAKLGGEVARLEMVLEKGLKEQTRFFFLAWAVQLAAIVGLYAR